MSWPIRPRRWTASPSRREASRMTTIGARKAASELIEIAEPTVAAGARRLLPQGSRLEECCNCDE